MKKLNGTIVADLDEVGGLESGKRGTAGVR